LAYDGTEFHGWQRQDGVRTAQDEVENVLRRLLRHPLHVKGASRTDSGVHARGQVATVMTTSSIPIENVARAVAHHLPADMALIHAEEVAPTFHPSLDATGKLYRYRVHSAVGRPTETMAQRFAWHVWYPLNLDGMRAAGALMTGTHDFAAFASQGSPRETTIRTVKRVEISRRGFEVRIDVEGDGFLYNQVRNMVGTLIEVGRGRWAPGRVADIIVSRDRSEAAQTAPAHGLCLQWIRYAEEGRPAYGTD
jgi:tRNA pseudouridine38-40 synthase